MGTEDVSLSGGSAQFDTKDVGTAKDVTGAGFALAGADKGNYTLKSSSLATKASITAKELTGSFTAADKVYDGNRDATITGRSVAGVVGTENVTLTGGSAQFDNKDVGSDRIVTGTGFALGGTDKGNYTLKSSTLQTKASITTKGLTASFTAADKTYDGNRGATITGSSLAGGVVSGEDVSIDASAATATFDTKNVGQSKKVAGAGFGLAGADAGNYAISSVADASASIAAKELTGSFTAADKVYDGKRDATITGRSVAGVVGSEDVGLTGGSAQFDTKDIGTDKDVTGSGFVLGGADKGNYTLTSDTLAAKASITPKELTGSFTAADKVYDGKRDATITGRSVAGVVGTEDVTLTGGSANFDSRNVGVDKTVSGTGFDLGGADKGNYSLGAVADTKAAVTPKELTGSFAAADKVYDGSRDATITAESLDGVVGTDDVTLSGGPAKFDTKDVGTGKDVTATGFALGGDDSGNYTLKSDTLATKASIMPKEVTGSFTADDKVYDGNRDATITGRFLDGVVGMENVTLIGGSATFDNRNIGIGKDVTGTGLVLGGDDKGNYTLKSDSLATKASITAKELTGSFTAADKVYDGNRGATITGRFVDGVVGTEDVTLVGGSAQFDTKDKGVAKDVTGSGFVLGGADKGNYTLKSDALSTKASITAKELTGSFAAADKVYDGNRDATITGRSLAGVVGTEVVSLVDGSAQFDTKNVGAGKDVTGTGFALGGDDKGNYTLKSSTLAAKASITAKELTGSFTAADKAYDGNTAATITGRFLTGVVGTEAVTLTGGSPQFDTKDVGAAKDVTGTGFALGGADNANYTLKSSMLGTKASITPKQLTGSFGAAYKVYDGNRNATITGSSLGGGVIQGEDVSLDASGATASFDNKNAGQNKTVTGSGFALAGADKGNYSLSMQTASASITPKSIAGSFTAADKIYDGTTAASITGRSLSGNISGDDVSLSGGTASFNTKNVGQNKIVTGSGFGLAGADKDNYSLGSVSGTTANITPKSIAGSFTAADKIYDGTTAASITGRSLSGNISGDDVSLSGGTASFNTKNVGQNKIVTGSGFGLAGADKDNYSLGSVSGTTASITPKSIAGSFTAADKIYDGTVAATIGSRSLSGAISGDDVSLSGGTATFADANVGQNKPVTGTGFGLAGADKDNYKLASVSSTTASITYAPASMSCLGSPGRTILQPINTDGTSVFKQGSTAPAKFRVCDAKGNSVGTAGVVASFKQIQTTNGTESAVNEIIDSTTPYTEFRWSPTDQLWIFNMSTKTLKAGQTYTYRVTLNDGTSFDFKFGLK